MPPFFDDFPSPQVGMPRRFSIGTIMILTTLFALLFGVLEMLRVPPMGFAAVSVFVAGVAACQALLYGGKNPRKASYVGGAAMYGLAVVVTALVTGYRQHSAVPAIGMMICGSVGALVVGGPLGYVAGCLVAGVFLVRKEPDDAEPTPEESVEHGP